MGQAGDPRRCPAITLTSPGSRGRGSSASTAEKEGNDLASYLTVWSSHQGSSSFPVSDLNSQWKLEWAKDGEQWRIVGIVPLQIGQTTREAIEPHLSRSSGAESAEVILLPKESGRR